MDVVVDDHLLLQVILNNEPADLRRGGARTFTTGLWYHRLCRAVAKGTITGALTRRLGQAEPAVATTAVRALIDLPEHIGLVSMRELSWPMAELVSSGISLNLLSLEALATALLLDGEICLAHANDSPSLLAAAASRGVPVRVIPT